MSPPISPTSLAFVWPLKLEYFSASTAALMFLGFVVFFVSLGVWSLAGLGRARQWTAIAVRLLVTLLFILILGGARWQREHKDVEVIVCSDISESIEQFTDFPKGQSYDAARDKYLEDASKQKDKQAGDHIGVISFADDAWIDAVPGTELMHNAKPIHEKRGGGTDIGSAIQLGLATFRNDAMRRLVLISDGNPNMGDIEPALAAAAAQHVPIDVFPLNYKIRNEVLMDKIVAPNWKRENEPFTIDIFLRSTNANDVVGKMTVLMDDVPIALDPRQPDQTAKPVTLRPGITPFRVQIPGLTEAGPHRFKATFEGASEGANKVDTLLTNNSGEAFTFIRGKGQVLYIDNARDAGGQLGAGNLLADALKAQGINLVTRRVEQFPTDLVALQKYDAVILANVPKGGGFGGLDPKQDEFLARYVHDMGGGLVMIGGPDTFGAGGWIDSKLKEVLPVNMEIPAQRQIPKGALALIMHSSEFPDGSGNYWGEQCALAAMKTLSAKDEIGVVSFDNGVHAAAGGVGGAKWDFPLRAKGDGSAVTNAIKNMALGDMMSFDDCVTLAVRGAGPGQPSLLGSDAKQRHIIIISDGDPSPCNQGLLDDCIRAKISISTVTITAHGPGGIPPAMKEMADKTKGRAYGPVEKNPNQLPQIFIKEATVIQRSLIHEPSEPIRVQINEAGSDLVKGIGSFPSLRGMVLTSRKDNAQNDIKLALVAANPGMNGKINADPLLAHWQTGLGRAVVFTGDATARWAPEWAGSPMFSKFWAQAVRSVARPPMSTDFDVQTVQNGTKGKIIVKANNKDTGFLNFMSITGTVLGPDGQPATVKLVQTGPGTYEQEFDAPLEGNYVVPLHFEGKVEGKDARGDLMGGLTINGAPEQRDLQSNDAMLQHIADVTGGRMLSPFDAEGANLFTREGLIVTASPLPIWDILIPILLGLLILDVAVRRIAWDWLATKKLAVAMARKVRDFTNTTRKVEGAPMLDALKKAREDVAEQKFKPTTEKAKPPAAPDPTAKFVARNAVEGDISNVVGGATDKPLSSAAKKPDSQGASGGMTGSLLEAKRRAQQQIRQKEKGE